MFLFPTGWAFVPWRYSGQKHLLMQTDFLAQFHFCWWDFNSFHALNWLSMWSARSNSPCSKWFSCSAQNTTEVNWRIGFYRNLYCIWVYLSIRDFPFNHKPFKHTVQLAVDGKNSIFMQYHIVKCSNIVPDFLLCSAKLRVIETTLMFAKVIIFWGWSTIFFKAIKKKYVDANKKKWFTAFDFLRVKMPLYSCHK